MIRRVRLLLSVVVILVVIAWIAKYSLQKDFGNDKIPNNVEFNALNWQLNDYRLRGQMVNSLLDSFDFEGTDTTFLIDLLGQNDGSIPFDTAYNYSSISYFVDEGGPFLFDMHFFYDSNGVFMDILFDD